ncbi:serine/threonine protein kinase, putative [Plasmodium gallinaceum]|uniref:Serine/threonine protein kinase, putative n=1 Tax=Plasmodium gallinaceum TaxID=5849 RepID=A0A1J1H3E1_PLAGA|nr:serine/threonine protein kinase, putative [Plasmodium gallinaceum]CRG98015.1 serine/threonine protein kinase, putative [Plasmodium gallinaceum]
MDKKEHIEHSKSNKDSNDGNKKIIIKDIYYDYFNNKNTTSPFLNDLNKKNNSCYCIYNNKNNHHKKIKNMDNHYKCMSLQKYEINKSSKYMNKKLLNRTKRNINYSLDRHYSTLIIYYRIKKIMKYITKLIYLIHFYILRKKYKRNISLLLCSDNYKEHNKEKKKMKHKKKKDEYLCLCELSEFILISNRLININYLKKKKKKNQTKCYYNNCIKQTHIKLSKILNINFIKKYIRIVKMMKKKRIRNHIMKKTYVSNIYHSKITKIIKNIIIRSKYKKYLNFVNNKYIENRKNIFCNNEKMRRFNRCINCNTYYKKKRNDHYNKNNNCEMSNNIIDSNNNIYNKNKKNVSSNNKRCNKICIKYHKICYFYNKIYLYINNINKETKNQQGLNYFSYIRNHKNINLSSTLTNYKNEININSFNLSEETGIKISLNRKEDTYDLNEKIKKENIEKKIYIYENINNKQQLKKKKRKKRKEKGKKYVKYIKKNKNYSSEKKKKKRKKNKKNKFPKKVHKNYLSIKNKIKVEQTIKNYEKNFDLKIKSKEIEKIDNIENEKSVNKEREIYNKIEKRSLDNLEYKNSKVENEKYENRDIECLDNIKKKYNKKEKRSLDMFKKEHNVIQYEKEKCNEKIEKYLDKDFYFKNDVVNVEQVEINEEKSNENNEQCKKNSNNEDDEKNETFNETLKLLDSPKENNLLLIDNHNMLMKDSDIKIREKKFMECLQNCEYIKNNYKMIKLLRDNSPNFVYECFDINKKINVAIKSVCKEKQMSIMSYNTYINIYKTIQNMNNSNVIKIYDLIENQTHFFIIMELCEGCDLVEYVSNEKISFEKAKNIIYQLLNGINALHLNSIIHRDIKLDNLMFKDKNREHLVIIDFDMSVYIDNEYETQGWQKNNFYESETKDVFCENEFDINDSDKNEHDANHFDINQFEKNNYNENELNKTHFHTSMFNSDNLYTNKLYENNEEKNNLINYIPHMNNYTSIEKKNVTRSLNYEYMHSIENSLSAFTDNTEKTYINEDEKIIYNDLIIGTKEYMSPYCLKGIYSEKTDIYSIGVTIFIILFKNFPYFFEENSVNKWENDVIKKNENIVIPFSFLFHNLNSCHFIKLMDIHLINNNIYFCKNSYLLDHELKEIEKMENIKIDFTQIKINVKNIYLIEIMKKALSLDIEQQYSNVSEILENSLFC